METVLVVVGFLVVYFLCKKYQKRDDREISSKTMIFARPADYAHKSGNSCNDSACTIQCGTRDRGNQLSFSDGYLYVSQEFVDRVKEATKNAQSFKELTDNCARTLPVTMCRQRAIEKGIDLWEAQEAYKQWWTAGFVNGHQPSKCAT